MADFGESPVSPEPEGTRNTTLIVIAIVVLVLLCCCCSSLVLAWNYGDYFLRALDDLAIQVFFALN